MIEEMLHIKLDIKDVLRVKANDEEVYELIKELNLIYPGCSTFQEIREQDRREIEYFYYSIYRGYQEGLRDAALISFASIISGLIGGMSVSFSTDAYFNEIEIENRAIDQYNLLVTACADPLTIAKTIVEFLLIEYQNPEPAQLHKKSISLTSSQINKINDLEGDSFSEKIRNLVDDYFKKM